MSPYTKNKEDCQQGPNLPFAHCTLSKFKFYLQVTISTYNT